MLRRRLNIEIHGSEGFTTIPRVVAMVALVGFLAMGVQLALQSTYAGKILPGVVVAGKSLGGKSLADARRALQKQTAEYRLELNIQDKKYILKPADIGVNYNIEETLSSAYGQGRRSWFLPFHIEPLAYSYDLNRHQAIELASQIASENGIAPIDASVVITNGSVSTQAEKSGLTVDKTGLVKIMERDVAMPNLAPIPVEPRVVRADIRVADLTPTVNEATTLMTTDIILSYKERVISPSQTEIGKWLTFEKINQDTSPSLSAKLDSAKLKSYIQELSEKLDVAPIVKKITVENGVTKVNQEGVEGTAIDRDPLEKALANAIMTKRDLRYEITSHSVPFKTQSTSVISLDYGQYIEVNLSRQHLWVWQDHNVIYESALTSGATGAGFGTVTGLFSIYYKTTNTHLRGIGYDVPVKYWMPFYSGYGLHDASWRNGKFGGQDYYYGGSHGCVNLPDAAAAFIYNWSSIGTPVWVHK
jgi:lipoprotein-anchoring transpeptidase ErfK/SrfK